MIPMSEFVRRRDAFLAQMEHNSVAIFPAAVEVTRSRDTEYSFRQHSDFLYLTGFPEPDAWLCIEKVNSELSKSILVCRKKDKLAEIWQGRRIGKENAKIEFLFDETEEEQALNDTLHKIINGKKTLYFAQGESNDADQLIFDVLKQLRFAPKKGLSAPTHIVDPRPIVHEMRLFKSKAEINVMKQAAIISANAHQRAMQFSARQQASGQLFEYQLEAEIHHEFAMNGARFPAYGTIVGSGENACILHYTENNDQINSNELVLIDAGCELFGYAADITRTFPSGGQFSAEQKAIYQLVLHTQQQVISAIQPGTTLKKLTDLSVNIITQGLVELGILTGEVSELIENNAHRAYYMHGLAHWLGLDVHDVGAYTINEVSRPLEAGMVFTVEPGIYIDSNSECDAKWHGIGVRIEDNILITASGCINLTEQAPKTIEEIESLMASSIG